MKKEMKLYTGTKTVKAMPMTMTKAQKMLGREIKPATVEEDGYLVEYKDGYRSWSPKSVFEEAYREADSVNCRKCWKQTEKTDGREILLWIV